MPITKQVAIFCHFLLLTACAFSPLCADSSISLIERRDQCEIEIKDGNQRVAVYSYGDVSTGRPYFAHLHAPENVRVSRSFPPIEGEDFTDHALMHPGLWMAYGDLSGADSWRLQAVIEHVHFEREPASSGAHCSFTVSNAHRRDDPDSDIIATDTTRFDFHKTKHGYLISWDATFSSDKKFYFGDQEEMGLGFRVASQLRVQDGGGRILDSQGRTNEEEIWGKSSEWCDYSGHIGGKWVGITLFCHPNNFRKSWLHARNYGFLAANPFGRKSFGHGKVSKVDIQPCEKLRLRYGILLHSHTSASKHDIPRSYEEYLRIVGS